MIQATCIITVTEDDLDWARAAVILAKRQFPGFCREGVSYGCDKSRSPWSDEALSQVVVAKHWLEAQEPIRTPMRNSYGLKHIAESWAGFYISNAALIAAAAGLLINQRQIDPTSPNTLVAISKRGLPRSGNWPKQVDKVIIEAQ